MSFLRTIRCKQCGATLKVPAMGSFHVQCGECNTLNSKRLPFTPGNRAAVLKAREDRKAFEEKARALRQETSRVKPPKPFPKPEAPTPKAVEPEVVEPEVVEETPTEPFPEWEAKMLKADLLEIAKGLGLDVDSKNKKAEIVEALEAAQAAHEA
jgi:phage FluMu protein Com